MANITIAAVNKALKAAGFDAEIVNGKGYLWFDGPEASNWFSSSVPVCHLNHISTVSGWVEKYRQMKADHDSKE